MTKFENIACVAFIILFIFGLKPTIKNFMVAHRNEGNKVSKGMRFFLMSYFGVSSLGMPFLCIFLIYLLITKNS
ncbi:hypothetical protein AZI87_04720 [Bdellovibrio bacteriovorus]|uniref:Uncharacterized protein n=1 Tax=Bdellovibrio bacteriovorus TaxID=959 RepID=A0A162GN59_BDEBC|nr:hypothetical protein AZI87_04720 [Bdellovibrio bacteriovorus]